MGLCRALGCIGSSSGSCTIAGSRKRHWIECWKRDRCRGNVIGYRHRHRHRQRSYRATPARGRGKRAAIAAESRRSYCLWDSGYRSAMDSGRYRSQCSVTCASWYRTHERASRCTCCLPATYRRETPLPRYGVGTSCSDSDYARYCCCVPSPIAPGYEWGLGCQGTRNPGVDTVESIHWGGGQRGSRGSICIWRHWEHRLRCTIGRGHGGISTWGCRVTGTS